jgi:catalase
MAFGRNGGRSKNYEPNRFDGPVQTNAPHYKGIDSKGQSGSTLNLSHGEDNDFVQAGALFRIMSPDEQERLIDNIAGSLAGVSRQDIIDESIAHFRKADSSFGERLTVAVKELQP